MKLTLSILTLQFTAVILFAQSPSPSTTGLQTDLSGSRLHLVSLANARFDESDLSKTAFRSVNLTGASFTSTNLTGAAIQSCDLSRAEISSCNLSSMKIDGVLVTDLQKAYAEAKKK